MSKKKIIIISVVITLFFGGPLFYVLLGPPLIKSMLGIKSEWDIVDKENPKIVPIFNEQLELYIEKYSVNKNAVYIPEAAANCKKYFESIRSIETYRKISVSGKHQFKRQLKITFNNGEVINTGFGFSSRTTENSLLLKILLKNGKAEKVFTNGAEKRDNPEEFGGVMYSLIKSVDLENYIKNKNNYYPAREKPKTDFTKEWEDL